MKNKKYVCILLIILWNIFILSLINFKINGSFINFYNNSEKIDYEVSQKELINNVDDFNIEKPGRFLSLSDDPKITLRNIIDNAKSVKIYISDLSKNSTAQVYYGIDDNFSEERVITGTLNNGKNIFNIQHNNNYNTLRLDLVMESNISFIIEKVILSNYIELTSKEILLYFILYIIGIIFILYIMLVKVRYLIKNFFKNLITNIHRIDLSQQEWLFVLFCFFLYYLWSIILPYNTGPDEQMRYDIPKFIYQYNQLPHGDDPRIRNEIWGTSYAYNPILSYIISAILMKIKFFISGSEEGILYAARFVSVLASTINVIFITKISNKLFKINLTKWLFVVLICLLPQFCFISGYVNNDALALLSVSIIIYSWIKCIESNWNLKDCTLLSIGISICALSYYNCYGYILCSIILVIISILFNDRSKDRYLKFFKISIFISIIVLVLIGWWFLRNYNLYGDILGMKTASSAQEIYAIDAYKPSNIVTIKEEGKSILYMFNNMHWLSSSWKSFIAGFDYMSLFLPNIIYLVYYFITGLAIIGLFHLLRIRFYSKINKNINIIYILFILSIIIVFILSAYYSYSVNFQAQGRYLLPMLVPLVYFITLGLDKFSINVIKEKRIFIKSIIIFHVFVSLYSLAKIIIPFYYH